HFFGVIVVQIIAIGMLVTLGSGVIIHLKSLLPNLVVFRPRATSPRPWVDAHVLTAVLFLPFLFTIAYTGVLIHANRLFPNTAIQRPDRGGGGGHGQHHSVPLSPLAPVLADAATKYGPDKLGFLQFSPRTISVFRADGSTIRLTRDHLEYDRKTGERLKEVSKDSPAASTSQFLSGIHMARWAPATVRWLYFVSGIAGYVMFATGLVMFLLKRRRKAEGRSPLGMVLAEGLTLATVLGLPLACVGVLWANRLLPAGMTSRVETETSTLFLVWAVAALHALLRGGGLHILRGWREQATLLSATLLLLPALDVATRWHWMGMQDQNVYFAVDAVAFALGLSALHLRRVLSRKETVRPDDLVSLSGGVKL
ncbi:PepSY-associated TM helix domain-containing protein, partial [Acetobacter sp.]|uniref:PepSY-associated TM helix domain-containing protein n=1 Tax=Acetobacter sp. TaxID=440 RepID=UPI0039E9EDB1